MPITRPTAAPTAVLLLTAAPAARAVEPAALLRTSRCDLDSLYCVADSGGVSVGCTRGTAITRPGTRTTVPVAHLLYVVWEGKVFPGDGTVVNRNAARPIPADGSAGWVGVDCGSEGAAAWVLRAVAVERVLVRRAGRSRASRLGRRRTRTGRAG